jgi:hypothetical protein
MATPVTSAVDRGGTRIGIGVGLAAPPPTPPDIRVRIRRFGGLSEHLFPQEGRSPGFENVRRRGCFGPCTTMPSGFTFQRLACRTDGTACLPHGTFEMRVSTPHFQPRTRGLDIKAGAAKVNADRAAARRSGGCDRPLESPTGNRPRHASVTHYPGCADRWDALAGTLLPGLRDEPGDRSPDRRRHPLASGRYADARPTVLVLSGIGANAIV